MQQVMIFYICAIISVLTVLTLIVSLLVYRRKKTTHFHRHILVELFWTVIPILLLLALAIPAIIVWKNMHN